MADKPLTGSSTIAAVPAVHGSAGDPGTGVFGETAGGGHGVHGLAASNGHGVHGDSVGGRGVVGISQTFFGVSGQSTSGVGVSGESSTNVGIFGKSPSSFGVQGVSETNHGVHGDSTSGRGVVGISQTFFGVSGRSTSGVGVSGESSTNVGVFGKSPSSFGVHGVSETNHGVHGDSTTGRGVQGISQTFFGVSGVSTDGIGVGGESPNGIGVFGKGGRLAARFEGVVEVTDDIRLTNGDCAEDFDIADPDPVEPGTVMILGDNAELRESHQPYDRRVAGVISGAGSYKPGIVLDKQVSTKNRAAIGLLGKVFCKVEAQSAPIEVGDLLTTSGTPGHAMRASDSQRASGAIIGKALRALSSGNGLIPILIALQ